MHIQLQTGNVSKRHGPFWKGCINLKFLFVFVPRLNRSSLRIDAN
jgi:hypothetical protein